MKSILLYANDDSGLEGRMQIALDIARAYGSHITCLHATPYNSFILGDPFGGIYSLPVIMEELRAAEETHRARIENDLSREGVAFNWLHFDGSPAQIIVDHSRLTDLIILTLPTKSERAADAPLSLTADVAIHARTPVLAVPGKAGPFDGLGTAIIAWNGSMESSHALRLSMPMLEKSSGVHIVTISDDDTDFPATEASEYLARHGVKSELHEWPLDGRQIADALIDAAAVLKGSHLIAGAYGHSRVREKVLGGVTKDLLDRSRIPLLLAH
jgi:nucleotide-binding universal stress UspA family protein